MMHVLNEECACVDRTGAVAEASQLVQLFGWQQYFCTQEIYPGDKTAHFRRSLDIHKMFGSLSLMIIVFDIFFSFGYKLCNLYCR